MAVSGIGRLLISSRVSQDPTVKFTLIARNARRTGVTLGQKFDSNKFITR